MAEVDWDKYVNARLPLPALIIYQQQSIGNFLCFFPDGEFLTSALESIPLLRTAIVEDPPPSRFTTVLQPKSTKCLAASVSPRPSENLAVFRQAHTA